jgi:hypothetical protein
VDDSESEIWDERHLIASSSGGGGSGGSLSPGTSQWMAITTMTGNSSVTPTSQRY